MTNALHKYNKTSHLEQKLSNNYIDLCCSILELSATTIALLLQNTVEFANISQQERLHIRKQASSTAISAVY